MLKQQYIKGILYALEKSASLKIENPDLVAEFIEKTAQMPMMGGGLQAPPPMMMPPGGGMMPPSEGGEMMGPQVDPQALAGQADPQELQQLQNSGLSSKDLESAAKVVQVMAEMKATADMAGMVPQQQGPGGMSAAGMPAAPGPMA